MANQNFNYYQRTWHTVETATDEIMIYDYTEFFNDTMDRNFSEVDIYDWYDSLLECELDHNMVIEDGYYPDYIKQIIFDMIQYHRCKIVTINGYDINTSIYGVYEIQLFVEIMQAANSDAIDVDFYFTEFEKEPKNKFSVSC